MRGWATSESKSTGDHFLVEALPVVEIVEVDGVEDFALIRDAAGTKDVGADIVGVVVADDGGIQFRDGGGIKRATGLGEHPGFKLRVGRLFFGDEALERSLVDAEGGEDHLVVALAAGWIVRMELARRAE